MLGLVHSIIIIIDNNINKQARQTKISCSFSRALHHKANDLNGKGSKPPKVGGSDRIWPTNVSNARNLGPGKRVWVFGDGVRGER